MRRPYSSWSREHFFWLCRPWSTGVQRERADSFILSHAFHISPLRCPWPGLKGRSVLNHRHGADNESVIATPMLQTATGSSLLVVYGERLFFLVLFGVKRRSLHTVSRSGPPSICGQWSTNRAKAGLVRKLEQNRSAFEGCFENDLSCRHRSIVRHNKAPLGYICEL